MAISKIVSNSIAPSQTLTTPVISGLMDLQGGQIKFPVDQVASSDANTLDDYEEGTWTPVFTGSVTNPTATYGSAVGYYIKVGKMVWFGINMNTSNVSSVGSGTLFVSGLPFTSNSALQEVGVSIGNVAYWAVLPTYANVQIANTKLGLLSSANTSCSVGALTTGASSANYLRCQGTYSTN